MQCFPSRDPPRYHHFLNDFGNNKTCDRQQRQKKLIISLYYIDRAILDLKNQRDKLQQYRKRITNLTDRETEIAKECLARNDRKRALLALRRKKYQESLLDKTDGQLGQLEQLTGQVEFALVQKDVLFGLQQGTQVLQTINKEMGGIEGVERLMGESEEARAYQEVSYWRD